MTDGTLNQLASVSVQAMAAELHRRRDTFALSWVDPSGNGDAFTSHGVRSVPMGEHLKNLLFAEEHSVGITIASQSPPKPAETTVVSPEPAAVVEYAKEPVIVNKATHTLIVSHDLMAMLCRDGAHVTGWFMSPTGKILYSGKMIPLAIDRSLRGGDVRVVMGLPDGLEPPKNTNWHDDE